MPSPTGGCSRQEGGWARITAFQVMPPLGAEDYEALKRDIAEVGVLVPVEYDEAGNVLDGHHRIRACQELGISSWPRLIREGLDETGKLTHARRLNIARRHLDAAQKRRNYPRPCHREGFLNP